MQLTQNEARSRISRAFAKSEPYSLSACLHALYSGGLAPGSREYDVGQQLAEEDGVLFDANRVKLPWSALGIQTRDLTSQTNGGGYLIASEAQPVALEPAGFSLAFDSGATVLSLPRGTGNIVVPRIAARPGTTWLSDEGANIAESSPTIGQSAATMKSVGATLDGTRQLRVQHPAIFDKVLQPALASACWRALDEAVISGSGSSGQPQGLASTAGVGSASGAGLSWATLLTLKAGAIAGGVKSVSWWAGANAEKALRGREKFSGGGEPIWGDAGIAGAPAYSTAAVTTDTLVVGDFSRIVIFTWGSPVLEVDPFSDFARGLWSARLVLDADFVCLTPACFSIATGVT